MMGSSCPRVGTLGGTTAGAPLWDPIALRTLPSVTVVYHIVTLVHHSHHGSAKSNTEHRTSISVLSSNRPPPEVTSNS